MKNPLPLTLIFPILLASTSSSQIVGGGFDSIRQWDGWNAGDGLGKSVSGAGDLNGDGFDDVIVGAPESSSGGGWYSGSVYAYSGKDGTQLFQWNGGQLSERFGSSVSAAGDVNGDGFDDVIVGSPNASPAGIISAGSAFVFSGLDGTLLYQWDGGTEYVQLGFSVSEAGDVNLDGFDDIIAGAYRTSPGGLSNAGSAYVYSGLDGSVLYLWNGQAQNDYFGWSVSSAGDVNGDGFYDVVIGASNANVLGFAAAGSAFVFSGLDGTLLYQWDGEGNIDQFGRSVSSAGDVNADGFDDLIVGMRWARVISTPGAAQVFSGIDGSLLFQSIGRTYQGNFGFSVSGAGDVNRDGLDDVIIGDPNSNVGGHSDAGSMYILSGIDGAQLHRWDGKDDNIALGYSVADAGDINVDGFPDVIIGSPQAKPNGLSNAGTAEIYGFSPFLIPDRPSFSSASGGILGYQLSFPPETAFDDYKILLSVSGTGPFHFGVDIPLTLDDQVIQTYYGNYPFQFHSDLNGSLDVNGNAYATFAVLPGSASSLIGRTFHLAAIVFAQAGPPHTSSVAVPFTIAP